MDTYKPHELAELLGLSPSTLRLWTKPEQYGDYFSSSARASGQRRIFDDQDARIAAYIAALKTTNTSAENVHANLKRLQADNWRELPDLPPAPPGVGVLPMMPREAAENRVRLYVQQIGQLQQRVDELETELEGERASHAAARAQLQTELTTTKEQLGELRGRLAVIEGERRPASYWLAIIAIVVIAALIIAAVLVALLLSRPG